MKSFKSHTISAGLHGSDSHQNTHVLFAGIGKESHRNINEAFLPPNNTEDLGAEHRNHDKDTHNLATRLESHYGNHVGAAGGEELKQYTNGSTYINTPLHKAHEHGMDITNPEHNYKLFSKEEPSYFKKLDSHIDEKEAPETFHVYSGIKQSPLLLQKKDRIMGIAAGKHTSQRINGVLPAYTSTSIFPHEATHFGKEESNAFGFGGGKNVHILKMEIPKGSKYGSYVGEHSETPNEKEFLMKRGMHLHIDPTPEIHDIEGVKHHIWHSRVMGFNMKEDKQAPAEYEVNHDKLQNNIGRVLKSTGSKLRPDVSSADLAQHTKNLDSLTKGKLSNENISSVLKHGDALSKYNSKRAGDIAHSSNLVNLAGKNHLTSEHLDHIMEINHHNRNIESSSPEEGVLRTHFRNAAKDAVMKNPGAVLYSKRKELENSF